MTIPEATVVNIALPHIQAGLRFSLADLSWVMNGYTLTFGGLLLLGGRAGDILGRRVFLAGIAIFTLASLAGGLATSPGMLLAARAVQGAGGALASPAVLALVVSAFPEGRERTRALGPLRAGAAFLPMTLALFAVSRSAPRLMPATGPRRLMIVGMLPVIAGMAWLSRVTPATGYWTGVLGPMLLFGIGVGIVFVPLTAARRRGTVDPRPGTAAKSLDEAARRPRGRAGRG